MRLHLNTRQNGITLIGLIFILGILACVVMVGLNVAPTFVEYRSIKNAIISAKGASTSPTEIRTAFDKQADVSYIESIKGKDLIIEKNGDSVDVSFAYDRKIPLIGFASLLLEYEGTTASGKVVKKSRPAAE